MLLYGLAQTHQFLAAYLVSATRGSSRTLSATNAFALMHAPRLAAIGLVALTASAHAVEQNALNPDASADNALVSPPLPRPRPPLRDTVADGAAALISAFRQQHGVGSVAVSDALTRIAQEQANAMAKRDLLDHELVAPFSQRVGLQFRPAAENIAFGHDDFADTLRQWINSSGHRANLLLPGAKWIGVAHASNGRRTYWAMVIAADRGPVSRTIRPPAAW